MATVLIIGAGGVGSVVTQKCAQLPAVFDRICLASRTPAKCEQIAARAQRPVATYGIDANDHAQVADLIRATAAELVINVALPYQDLSIMEGCLAAGADYLDTANYEPVDEARFCYQWQWDYDARFRDAGRMALLGSGFDPGVTNVFCAYAQQHLFDRIESIDIIDGNAGDHGQAFATNFNPEINIREVTAPGRHYADGQWITTPPLSVHRPFSFPAGIGEREIYLLYHEELESLVRFIPGLRRIRFWMTFSAEYLTHLRVLQNVGMTRIDPVPFGDGEIVPLKFLKALLPDPASLGASTRGRTCIGCLIKGERDGCAESVYIYNTCDHEACYREVRSQAVAYTAGVPAMIGAALMLTGKWRGKGVFNMEQLDPAPFMEMLPRHGLPWTEKEL